MAAPETPTTDIQDLSLWTWQRLSFTNPPPFLSTIHLPSSIPKAHVYPLTPTSTSIPLLWPAFTKQNPDNAPISIPLRQPINKSTSEWLQIAGISVPPWASSDVLDAMIMDLRLRGLDEVPWLSHLLCRFPESEKGWVRLGEWAKKRDWWKGVVAGFRAAIYRTNDGKRKVSYEKQLVQIATETQWRVWTKGEREVLEMFPDSVREEVIATEREFETTVKTYTGPRLTQYVRMNVPGGWWKLPRFFSWIVPGVLAGMSTPKGKGDIDALGTQGITQVITLTAEELLPTAWFTTGVRNTFIPVQNYFPPTTQQMDKALRMVVEETTRNPAVRGMSLVHCGGGKGRAGTVLACFIALFGLGQIESVYGPPMMEGRKAIELLREMRPGSVETEKQEKFIEKYISLAWKRYGQNAPLYGDGGEVHEPVGQPLEIQGTIEDADVIMLIGLQGSGKSTFCKMAKLRNPNIVTVSPDEVVSEGNGAIGSASASRACEGVLGRFKTSPSSTSRSTRRVLLIDRCNPTALERKQWLSLLTATDARRIAIHFDYPATHCKSRVENRSFHPTLPPWRANSAIDSTQNLLAPPTLSEGFSGIATVRGIDNFVELANRLFGPIPMLKFIRTKHLLDLGSATRDDLVLSPEDLNRYFRHGAVVVQEKIDGANLGISLTDQGELQVQNRSHYVSSGDQAQFSFLGTWVEENKDALKTILLPAGEVNMERYVLYGEWMVAVHSIEYTHLPDWFVAFDIYDRFERRFLTPREVENRIDGTGISKIPAMFEGELEGTEQLLRFLEERSKFSPEVRVEGVVVRFGNGERGKVVRGDFLAGNRHWSKNEMRKNTVRRE